MRYASFREPSRGWLRTWAQRRIRNRPPGKGVDLDHHEHRPHKTDAVDKPRQFFFDMLWDKVHGHHVDEKGLKGDVEVSEECQELIGGICAFVDEDVGDRLKQFHERKVPQGNPQLFFFFFSATYAVLPNPTVASTADASPLQHMMFPPH